MEPPLEFQAGDILGIFQPHPYESRIRVNYEGDIGPLNYFLRTGEQAVEPPLVEFNLNENTVNEEYSTPIIVVEIGKSLSFIDPSVYNLFV